MNYVDLYLSMINALDGIRSINERKISNRFSSSNIDNDPILKAQIKTRSQYPFPFKIKQTNIEFF